VGNKFNYINAALVASEMVAFFGSSGVITRQTTGTIDPATGATQTGVTSTFNGTITPTVPTVVLSDGSISKTVGVSYWIGVEIMVGDYYGNNRVDSLDVIKSPDNKIIVQKLMFNG
jgi:hypothetical protein